MATQRVVIDPITRIEGHLRIELETDGGMITDAWACSTQFRGIETILKGHDPRDAWALAQRICGVCTGIHAIASIRAVEDAIKYPIPKAAELIRNLVTGMGIVQDHVMHLYHLHALDWVDVKSALGADPQAAARLAAATSAWPNNSATWFREVQERVGKSVAEGQLGIFAGGYWGHPAYRLPPEANLLAVAHYLEALQWQREIIRLHAIFGGKNPHPNFQVGGMACAINLDNQLTINTVRLDELWGHIKMAHRFVDQGYYPDVLAIAGFYKDYATIGVSSPTLLATGECGFSCAGTPQGGDVRPGILLDGNYKDLQLFDPMKISEFVTSSWYTYPGGDKTGLQPWQGETVPRYTGPSIPYQRLSDNVKYTWVKAPRYDGRAVQVGPNARLMVAWDWPLRAVHWLAALLIIILSITGFRMGVGRFVYVGTHGESLYFSYLRLIHFGAAWLLLATAIIRIAGLFLASNKYQRWDALFPVKPRGLKNLFVVMQNYLFCRFDRGPHYIGHNPLQQVAYTGIYGIGLFAILTGFALYALYAPDFWLFHYLIWLDRTVGVQYIRLAHLLSMWVFLIFIPIHVYLATRACLRTAGVFFMLDTSLAHRRHFPAINWFQSYSLYERKMVAHFNEQVSPRWGELHRYCREILQREEALREVAEIVGIEGLQDADRLLMKTAERIRDEFLSQNAYTDDAFSTPEQTATKIGAILGFHDRAQARLKEGALLDEVLKE